MFIQLTTHSAYSLQEGLLQPEEIVQAAQVRGMTAIGLTDHHILTGSIEFVSACKRVGIQPILGLEVDLPSGRLALLATSLEGWSNLCRLSSLLALRADVATERLYLTAFRQFISFLSAEEYADIPVIRILEKLRRLHRIEGRRVPDVDIEGVKRFLRFMEGYQIPASISHDEILRIRRDRALIFILAEAGLRIEEACKLKRKNINWTANQARLIGKKDKEAIVRLSTKSLQYLRDYLATRQDLDGASGKALQALPLFARHDLGAGRRISAITTTTGREIIGKWVDVAGLVDLTSPITPHSLRHYFVTRVYEATGDLKLAQELARHESTETTERYTHLINPKLDEAYRLTFESR